MLFRLSRALPAARAPRRAALFFSVYQFFRQRGRGAARPRFLKKKNARAQETCVRALAFMPPGDIYAVWPFRRAGGALPCWCAARAELPCIRPGFAAPGGW